jgi:hypothetical protein
MYKWIKFSALSALLLSLVLWGCSDQPARDLTGPSVASYEQSENNGYTVVRTGTSSGGASVSATIDASGGKLILDKHELVIPKDAVSAPTVFSMTRLRDDDVIVGLTATRATTNDAGEKGFAVPVKLTLSYEGGTNLPADLSKLLRRAASETRCL